MAADSSFLMGRKAVLLSASALLLLLPDNADALVVVPARRRGLHHLTARQRRRGEHRRGHRRGGRAILVASAAPPAAESAAVAAAAVDLEELRASMRLYNTMSRSKEAFEPLAPPRVTFYSCGPTVYDFAHIGNFRAFLTYDVLKKWLRYLGYDVEHICNLTDIDDKIIARMARDDVSLKDLTNEFADYFFEDLEALNVEKASHYPRATEHIEDIVTMVSDLVKKKVAYEVNDSYYFEVGKFARYGRLARLDFDGMEEGAGTRNEDEGGGGGGDGGEEDAVAGFSTDLPDASEGLRSEKRGARDFALWKAFKPGTPAEGGDGEVAWETPLGKGRPGWHIECSAMIRRFFGDQIDVHAGGVSSSPKSLQLPCRRLIALLALWTVRLIDAHCLSSSPDEPHRPSLSHLCFATAGHLLFNESRWTWSSRTTRTRSPRPRR